MRVRWARGVGLTHVNKHVVRRYIIDIKEKKKRGQARDDGGLCCQTFGLFWSLWRNFGISPSGNKFGLPARPRKIKTNQVCLSCHPGQAVNLLSASIKKKGTHRAVTRSSAGKHPRRHK